RIVVPMSVSHLHFVERIKVVLQNKTQHRMIDVSSLNHNFSFLLTPPCTTANLRNKLVGSFIGTKIGKMHHPISIEDAHKAHSIEVQSFRHHLSADENIGLASFE